MAETTHTTGTVEHKSGFPPFDQTTFPSQIFWLAITFAFLLVVMWRFVVPRIGGTIAARRARIAAELANAEADKTQAEREWSTYQNTLVEARQRARAVSQDNRAKIVAETERAETEADEAAQAEIAQAEARLAQLRADAKENILAVAQEAAVEIVSRLTGETVSAEDAASAIRAVQG
ncbi:MAG: ATP F0F1 synthase subunit B [Rhizomicrobium sp.]|jgi:F-type H+-transporting ATPase subunit b